MKKTISTLVIFFLFLIYMFDAFGAEGAKINGETIDLYNKNEHNILLRIENNSGIMGFKIHLEYPTEKVKLISSEKGDVTKAGNYGDNIGSKLGEADILWNDTKQITEDGVISIIKCEVLSSDDFEIKISYSQPDTFNEEYEDVILSCSNVYFGSNSEIHNIENEIQEDKNGIEVISSVFKENNIVGLENIRPGKENELLSEVNDRILEETGKKNYYSSYDDLILDYKTKLKTTLKDDIIKSGNKFAFKEIVGDALKNSNSIQLNKEDVPKVMRELEKNGLSNEYKSYLSQEELLNILQDIYNSTANDQLCDIQNNDSNNQKLVLLIVLLVVTLACIIIIFGLKRRRKYAQEKKC